MRVVLDNNVFISGIFWKGPPNKIVKLAEQGRVEIFTTSEILDELFGVLRRNKFKLLFQEVGTTLGEVTQKVLELTRTCIPKTKIRVVKEDPDDNEFLACAIAAQASFIISGDEHLLKIKEFQGIPIVSPKEFLRIIKAK